MIIHRNQTFFCVSFLLPALAIAFLCCFCPIYGWAAAGNEGASFLEIPVGAGPAALGSAYTALAFDAYAPTWNAGGLGLVDSPQLAAQHLSYLESIHDEYLSFAYPLAPGHTLGFSAQYLGSGDIPSTDAQGNPIGSFSNHYGAYSLAYGQALASGLSLGITGKWINAELGDVSANAFAADLGALYKVKPNLMVGATLMNMGSALTFIDQADPLPLTFRTGLAWQPFSHWTFSFDGQYDRMQQINFHGGMEWEPMPFLALRAGYRTDNLHELSPMAGMSTGIGIRLWGQEFAYAWVPYSDLGQTQYFSLVIHFGENARKNLIDYRRVRSYPKPGKTSSDEPDYQLLMNLLSSEDARAAQAHPLAFPDDTGKPPADTSFPKRSTIGNEKAP